MSQFLNMSIMRTLITWKKSLNMLGKVEQVQEIITLDLRFLFVKLPCGRKVSHILVPQFGTNCQVQ